MWGEKKSSGVDRGEYNWPLVEVLDTDSELESRSIGF